MEQNQFRQYAQNQFRQYAQIHIDITKKSFGIDLGFDEKSILKLDDLIQEAWPDQPPTQIDNVILLFGSFLGEAIKQTLGGEWVQTEQGWGIKIGDATLMVFTKIKKRLLNGIEGSISYYYQITKGMLKNNFKDIIK
ncbi:hypothetical protein COS61_01745 [Candidatus Wolfebacteria bacterium CG03_land_8_20_14_0_80_40_12]|uniref:DUF3806 domain-containing protein n=1 Tax=Candidatus Wolfebacteria bacterium CG03_land_8_20_14_0_80_40_12 TaxID=1975069 RepID=A0A2M7B5K9_9BACT|nr:MAG: hypothetical protein COS61_01745 [Candidatus Wolfebacteria bacterium CG03_land_8_20_14_0_80_40_12]